MKNIVLLLFWASLTGIAFTFPMKSVYAQNAKEIVQKADDKRMGATSQSTIHLTIIRPKWKREMTLKTWTKGKQYLMILISNPARDKGTVFLKRDKEFWNWVPRIERNVKLPPSAMAQAWMGSDFSNDDLVKMSSMVEDYDHKLLGEEELNGNMAYKIEMIPKEESAVVWGKIITWIHKKEMLFLKTEYYDEDDELVNTILGKNIRMMGVRTVTAMLEIIPAGEPGNKTMLVYENLIFNEEITDAFFSLRNMKRVK